MIGQCGYCGLNHRGLGVEISGGVLRRRLDSSKGQLLRMRGGAIGFNAMLIDVHLGEINELVVEDVHTGTVYKATVYTLMRHGFKRTLDLRAGEQFILPLEHWHGELVNRAEVA